MLSKASVQSEWCKKELEGGLVRELEEKKVVVLPVVLDDCELPLFVRGKVFADFRSDFDAGLSTLLEAIAHVTSASLGRIEEPDFHSDWAIDWKVRRTSAMINMIIIDHSAAQPYSCLTHVYLSLDHATSKYFIDSLASQKPEYAEMQIIGVLVRNIKQGSGLRLKLQDERPRHMSIECSDSALGFGFMAEVQARRVGEDTGRDVLLDVGTRIVSMHEWLEKVVAPPGASKARV